MTYADPALVVARTYLRGKGIPGSHIGIVGDQSHQSTGGYHVGNDVLVKIGKLHTDYSKRQSSRDRPGSNAAMALDIGGLSGQQLYELTAWLIAQCKANAPDAADIREVIGRESPSGGIVRYDRLGLQFGEPAGHDTHTHLSYFRDSEGRNKVDLFRRYYGDLPTPVAESEPTELEYEMFFFAPNPDGAGPRWAVVTGGYWVEYRHQEDGNNVSGALGPEGNARNAQVCTNPAYVRLRDAFAKVGRVLTTDL